MHDDRQASRGKPEPVPEPVLVTLRGQPALPATCSTLELDLSKFQNGRWALQLDAAFARRTAPVVLLARGIACLAITWWAQLSPRSYLRAIDGAVFLSPLDVDYEQAALAATIRGGPAYRLPFASVVVSDGAVRAAEVLTLADAWGSRFVEIGAPATGQATNRQGPGTGIEDMLLGYLPRLIGPPAAAAPAAASTERNPPDRPRPL